MARHWYRVELMTAGDSYSYIGSSPMSESEMVERLSRNAFVELEDLTYFDEEGKPRRWSEWDPHCVSRIHLNPRYVLSILPLVEDPRAKSSDGSKVLEYPGLRPPQGEG
jgi:hypothetical protein